MPPLAQSMLVVVAAYLLGSLSGSLLLGRLRGVDIRTLGSGNAGGTNALRTQGWRFALGVVAIDVGKGALAAWLGWRLAAQDGAWSIAAQAHAAAFAAMLGHVWPLWHGFRGGKAAATLLGALLVLWPAAAALMMLAWGLVVLASGYVGLATVLGGACLPLAALLSGADRPRLGFALAAAALLLFTHRGNLRRLARGEESRFRRARWLSRLRRGGRA